MTDDVQYQKPEFFKYLKKLNCGELHIKEDDSLGLTAIIAIHNNNLGPALGGCRFVNYDFIEDGIIDAIRLAHGMSYKAALAQLSHGGGKAVIIRRDPIVDRHAIFKRFGEFVHELGGRYITAQDSGTIINDMDSIAESTSFVAGNTKDTEPRAPSPLTALGVKRGIEAAVKHQLKRDDLEGIHVAVQGVGNVGYALCKYLHESGAKLSVCDVNLEAVQQCVHEFGANEVAKEEIHMVECDVFSPCALSNAVNSVSIEQIQAPIIAGAANNQLATDKLAKTLLQKGKLYAPDFAINAGGLIRVAADYAQAPEEEVVKKTEGIFDTLLEIFDMAAKDHKTTIEVARQLAEARIYQN